MDDLSFLTEHISIPAKDLGDPAPSQQELEQILQAAMSAPDHGGLSPFRFLIIQGDARLELSKVFERAVRKRHPEADEATVLKQKSKPLRSPIIIVVIANVTDNPGIPQIEQLLCAGCAAQHIQLACKKMGYGSIWLTGENSDDLTVYEALGLDINERIIGFIYVGTGKGSARIKQRMAASSITQYWKTSQHADFAI